MLSYSREELHEELRSVWRKNPTAAGDAKQAERVVNQAVQIALTGLPPVAVYSHPFKGKEIFRISDPATNIVLNRASRILRSGANVKQTDRTTTVKRISKILSEGARHRVYQFDIQSFYETIDLSDVWDYVDNLPSTDRQTSKVLRSFVDLCSDNSISGAPRGLGISAVLAELSLREFDLKLKSLATTYFYARYVDDILLITSGDEAPLQTNELVAGLLPSGLRLHPTKSKHFDLAAHAKNSPASESEINFLGYRMAISEIRRTEDERLHRIVSLDISSKKVSRLKVRIARATLEFLTDGKFSDFEDRMKVLSGNYNIVESRWRRRINVGLYCNYRLVDADRSTSLPAMDKFLRAWILGYGGTLSSRLAAALTPQQSARLIAFSFEASFRSRRFYHFPANRLRELRKCWVYA
ncbi:antiviral reverse transcriptase Drt3a [Devosia sediminis]|uniref:RNA-directed DNA polymerase n=1 Tax=Devosia sediminis TaxID=2798801 RepID=A0A934ISE9_9HYPH|nr:antiviral reverse transcriptase Drt3a [Devosia sediminis]MBJ3785933.1 RNA-directed DNA polymerase [Devosia sediminis]